MKTGVWITRVCANVGGHAVQLVVPDFEGEDREIPRANWLRTLALSSTEKP